MLDACVLAYNPPVLLQRALMLSSVLRSTDSLDCSSGSSCWPRCMKACNRRAYTTDTHDALITTNSTLLQWVAGQRRQSKPRRRDCLQAKLDRGMREQTMPSYLCLGAVQHMLQQGLLTALVCCLMGLCLCSSLQARTPMQLYQTSSWRVWVSELCPPWMQFVNTAHLE